MDRRRITRIILPTLPSQRYRRQSVRTHLDIVGKSFVVSVAIFNQANLKCMLMHLVFSLCHFQFRSEELWDYFLALAF